MKYVEKPATVNKVKNDRAEVTVPRVQRHASNKCIGCGRCTQTGSSERYKADIPTNISLDKGDTVVVGIPELPFRANIFFVFLLPIVLMTAVPGAGIYIGSTWGVKMLFDIRIVVLEGLGGLVLAGGVNFILNRYIEEKYPCVIVKKIFS